MSSSDPPTLDIKDYTKEELLEHIAKQNIALGEQTSQILDLVNINSALQNTYAGYIKNINEDSTECGHIYKHCLKLHFILFILFCCIVAWLFCIYTQQYDV